MRRLLSAIIAAALLAVPSSPAVAGHGIPSTLVDQNDNPFANRATYRSESMGYAGYATPTDMVGMCGSATKTVFITVFTLSAASTAQAIQTIYFVRRTAPDTGGTPTTGPAAPLDSADAAASTAPVTFGSAPSLGASAGNVTISINTSTVLTGIGSALSISQFAPIGTPVTFSQPLTLRGTSDCIYANYNGAALSGGFVAAIHIEWIEF